jgi:hypothetical protein
MPYIKNRTIREMQAAARAGNLARIQELIALVEVPDRQRRQRVPRADDSHFVVYAGDQRVSKTRILSKAVQDFKKVSFNVAARIDEISPQGQLLRVRLERPADLAGTPHETETNNRAISE